MKTVTDLCNDLEFLKMEVRDWTEEQLNELAYSRLITLAKEYRPIIQETGGENSKLDKELLEMLPNVTKAMIHCRAKLGISLREAKDYVERLQTGG